MDSLSRREALSRLVGFTAGVLALPRVAKAAKPFPHPDPRPGITAANVIPVDQLPRHDDVLEAYDAARQHPEIFDGLYCACDCRDSMGHRSLLSCFESMQPTGCGACKEEGILAGKLIKDGKTLPEIRQAFDAKWG